MMSYLKNIFALAAIAGFISFAASSPAQAQNTKQQTNQEIQSQANPYQRNLKEINAFAKTTDVKALMNIVSSIKNNLREELAFSKRQIMMEKENGNDSKAAEALEKTNELGQVYNKIVKASRSAETLDKAAISAALKDYQKLH